MSEYCKQCSTRIFGEDTKDLAGITRPEDWKNDLAVWVICEGCGHTQVDPDGACIRKDCDVDHNFPATPYTILIHRKESENDDDIDL